MGRKAPDESTIDPKGVIAESYRIEGISEPECRSIFLDWAISIPSAVDPKVLIGVLLARYGEENPNHPMTRVLRAGLDAPEKTGRRGGRAARFRTEN